MYSVHERASSNPEPVTRAGCRRVDLSAATQARIAVIRAERRAYDDARAEREAAGKPRKYPSLEVEPFHGKRDALIDAIALRMAAETGALVGILFLVLAILAGVALFGDAPGMATALAAAGI